MYNRRGTTVNPAAWIRSGIARYAIAVRARPAPTRRPAGCRRAEQPAIRRDCPTI